ncbi:Ribosomal protein S3, N-terminal domain [Salmonella enterica subsp. enterica]|nr:Ribosomal protein S3, N-terminal domain [Salmonella enterica subsp. arizonae]VEA30910.1 Ribosomal protein S3, N-terminal domain [Salmonella enterica subsp. enterica]
MGQKVHPNGIRLGIVKTMELYLVCEHQRIR